MPASARANKNKTFFIFLVSKPIKNIVPINRFGDNFLTTRSASKNQEQILIAVFLILQILVLSFTEKVLE